MRRVVLFVLCASLYGTDFDTNFGQEIDAGTDAYGNKLYQRSVAIDTNDKTIKNHFGSYVDNKDTTFTKIGKQGTFQIIVSSNSLCAQDDKLDANGCSGQKPFLINNELLTNNAIVENDIYQVIFNEADMYTNTKNDAFFPLDIQRSDKYFKATTTTSTAKKSFFERIKEMFTNYFSADTTFYGDNLTADEEAIRDRYIANIVAGIDQDHLLTMQTDKTTSTLINSGINNPVSLLDYEALMTSVKESCKGVFLTRDPDSAFCRMVSGFSMASWMPFFSETTQIDTETSSVMADTETALLTAVGELNGVNITSQMKSDADESTSFFGEIFKPMTFMFDSMMSFFFGDNSSKSVAVVSNHYDFTKYAKLLTMTFAVTNDGSSVDDFQTFSLQGLDSVYGSEVASCTFKRSYIGMCFFMPCPKTDTYVLLSTDSQNKEYTIDSGGSVTESIYENTYNQLDFNDDGINTIQLETTKDDMFAWCARRAEYQSLGILGRIRDLLGISSIFVWNQTKEEQMDSLLADRGFDVEDYQEKNHRGLILHLKKNNLITTDTVNSVEFKLIKSENN